MSSADHCVSLWTSCFANLVPFLRRLAQVAWRKRIERLVVMVRDRIIPKRGALVAQRSRNGAACANIPREFRLKTLAPLL
jgi:hypothetical protein